MKNKILIKGILFDICLAILNNARTRKGRKKTVANKKKATK